MIWYKRFGYKSNPFERDPFKIDYTLINSVHILEDLLYLVKVGSLAVIQSPEGGGKTTTLRQIVDAFKGQGRVVYIDALKVGKSLDIEDVLNRKNSPLLSFVSSKKPKNMILLLDNVEYLSSTNCEKIKYYFDQNYIQSVVFATSNYESFQISQSLKDRIMNQVFTLPAINKYDALRIIRNRFSDAFFLGDDAIYRIFKLSGENIKFTIRNCENVCRFVVQEGRGEVLLKYIRLVLGKQKSQKIQKSQKSQVKSQKQYETNAYKRSASVSS